MLMFTWKCHLKTRNDTDYPPVVATQHTRMCKIKLYESHTPVLLAGGMGTRLRSVLGEIPKPIARVKENPFISILLTQLEREGFNTAIISTGYKENYIRECLSEENHNLKKSIPFHKTKPLGTGAI